MQAGCALEQKQKKCNQVYFGFFGWKVKRPNKRFGGPRVCLLLLALFPVTSRPRHRRELRNCLERYSENKRAAAEKAFLSVVSFRGAWMLQFNC